MTIRRSAPINSKSITPTKNAKEPATRPQQQYNRGAAQNPPTSKFGYTGVTLDPNKTNRPGYNNLNHKLYIPDNKKNK